MTIEGLITVRSSFSPTETMIRLKDEVAARGMAIFAQVDHAAGASAAGLSLRPTDVLIFGSPKGGTPLMQSSQSIGIDLPLRVLVWQEASGATWLSYNDPSWLAKRHGVSEASATVSAMTAMLRDVANAATGTQEGQAT